MPKLISLILLLLFGTSALANTELDRRFSLETIGCLSSSDNVDGLFVEYVNAAYEDYFERQSRFKLQDLSKADAILTDSKNKTPYYKIIQDLAILGQVARATRSESLVRTTIQKEGHQYRFKLDWLLAPKMDLLAEESFVLSDEKASGIVGLGDIQGALQQALDKLIRKVPYVGQVSGRDEEAVTLDIGRNAKVGKGDTLLISTLDDVKLHPLLKSVVEWRMSPVGKVEVEEVDEQISFGRVIEENPAKKIARHMKVTQIIPAPVMVHSPAGEERKPKDELPTLGWVSGSLGIGSFGRQYTTSASSLSGSGLLLYPRAEGQLWLTQEWFLETGFGYGFTGFSQSSSAGAATSGGSTTVTTSNLKFALGYSYLANGSFFGPKGMIKIGYHTQAYGMPHSLMESTDSIGFGSILLGLGGELPIRERWAAVLNLNFGLFASGVENNRLSGSLESASMGNFYVGAQYHYDTRVMLRFGMDLTSNEAAFDAATLNHKILTFGPSILYYF